MDEKDARRLLDLGDDATREDIERRYSVILKRIKNGEEIDPAPIHEAYDTLLGRDDSDLKERGRISKAYNSFMYKYKGWIILGFISLAILTMILVPMIFKKTPDLVVSFAGKYSFSDDKLLHDILAEEFPEHDYILVETMYLDDEGESGEFDMGGRTRLTALILTEEADLLVTDSSAYWYVMQDNALMPLDGIIAEFDFEMDKSEFIYGINQETGEKSVYGIDVSGLELVEESIYGADDRIMCVAKKTHHLEDVVRTMEIILTYGE